MFKLSENIRNEQKKFRIKYQELIANKISTDEFKHYSSAMGVYSQRKPGTYMVRPRILSGLVTVDQLKKISDLSKKYSFGKIHLTTRQDVQFHQLNLDNVPDILESLLSVNLINKGAGGNSVRNVSCSHLSGVKENEIFDVTQHAKKVTEYLLSLDNICSLPRKYKIAFSSSCDDIARATVSDLGFIAKIRNGIKGFEVYAGGGLGGSPTVSIKVEDFIKEEDILYYAKAMMDLFDKEGDRNNRSKARIRFIRYRLGDEEFARLFNTYVDNLKQNENLTLKIQKESKLPESDEIYTGNDRRVFKQKNKGMYSIIIHASNGDILAKDLDQIINYTEQLHYNVDFRLTGTQAICVRNVKGNDVEGLLNIINQFTHEYEFERIVSCTGAANCRIGLCNTNGLIKEIENIAKNMDKDILDKLPKIYISGCNNSCGWHHIGSIGFSGSAIKGVRGSIPAYSVYFKGKILAGQSMLAQKYGVIPARNISPFLKSLVAKFSSSGANNFDDFINENDNLINELLNKYSNLDIIDSNKIYFDFNSPLEFLKK